jgi:cephalosporin hydroxylase
MIQDAARYGGTCGVIVATGRGVGWQEPEVEVLTAPSASKRMQERVRALRLQYPGPLFVIHDADHGADNVTLELQVE